MPCDSDIEPETPECRPTLPTAAIVAGMETESTLAMSSSSRSSRVESDSESDQSAVVSLLQRLRSPTPSDLARKRIVTTNPPIGAKRGKVGHASTGLKVLSAADRVKSYLGESFTVSNKKLFCEACREEIALKKSVIESHIASQKHKKGKERQSSKILKEKRICEALKAYDKEVHPIGETLPDEVRVRRVKVVRAMLRAGVPISKVDSFRDLLEENHLSLTSASNLRQLLPFILHQEVAALEEDIAGRPVSIIFDGTTHVAEAMVIVLRFVDDNWQIQQRVCRLLLLSKSMTGEELARQIISVLSTELSIPSSLVIAASRDRASVNEVAMRTVTIVYNNIMDIGCYSHTLDNVGGHMQTPTLDKFVKAWIALFSHSPKSRLLWRMHSGLAPPSFSPTRWWSKYEVIAQLHAAFSNVMSFLQTSELPATTVRKMTDILNNAGLYRKLKIELAVTVDAMGAFVKATYDLEGDGPLSLTAYERIRSLYAHIAANHFPNVTAVIAELANGDSSRGQQLILYSKACVQPAYAYFKAKFDVDLAPTMTSFKAARFFSPTKVGELQPTATELELLSSLPFLGVNDVASLKSELPIYLAAIEGISSNIDPLNWWCNNADKLPNWSSAFKKVILMQPSSAAAERVFSILTFSFSKLQTVSLEDYVQLSVMLQYNHRS